MNKIIKLTFLILLATPLVAQEENKKDFQQHELTVGLLGGVQTLDYKLSVGKSSKPISGGVGIGYTYFFAHNVGLATGLDLAFYNTKVTLDNYEGSHTAFDNYIQKEFDFRYSLQEYEETQNAFYANVPIMIHYQLTNAKTTNFYVSGGAKIGIPISGKYKSKGATLKTSGYFPHDNSTLTNPRFRGFGDFTTKKSDNELKYKMSFSLALEAGAKWDLPSDLSLYTGAYFDYGLNDIKESTQADLSLIQYNPINPEEHIFNGIAKSSYRQDNETSNYMTSKVRLMAYGLKVRLAFGK